MPGSGIRYPWPAHIVQCFSPGLSGTGIFRQSHVLILCSLWLMLWGIVLLPFSRWREGVSNLRKGHCRRGYKRDR